MNFFYKHLNKHLDKNINKQLKSALISFIALPSLCFVSSASSQQEAWLSVAKPSLKRVVYDTSNDGASWLLPLGPIERIDGLWLPEKRLRLEGQLRRRTIEFNAAQSEQKIFDAYQKVLTEQGAQLLFRCFGRDCGRSNNWANRFFSVYQLYGKEDSQRLGSYRWLSGGQEHYVTLYLVRRGNKRIYLQQEWLSRQASSQAAELLPTAEQLWQSWRDTGVLRLTQAGGQLDKSGRVKEVWVNLIAAMLNSQPQQGIECVAHDFNGIQSKANSAERLKDLSAELIKRGVDQHRLVQHNLANLAPLNSRPESARIDLLLR